MGRDPQNAIMLDVDNDGEIHGTQQASLAVVEYIDLSDDKHYKSRAYGRPSVSSRDFSIFTSQTRSNGKIVKIQKKPIIHDGGSTSYDQDRYQQLDTEDSHQTAPMDGMRNLADVRARKNTTNSLGVRNSEQQLQTTIVGSGADFRLDALPRDCQRGSSISRPRLTSLRPLGRVQAHDGIAHQGPDSNANTAASQPLQGERRAQERPSDAPKMGFAALETLRKARPAPFGTLKIDSSSHREKQDQLFVSDSEDQGQGGDRLCFQNSTGSSQQSCATQQNNIGKQGSPRIKQIARQTQKSSRGDRAAESSKRRESSRLAREFAPTEVCGVFSESRVPAGCNPARPIRRPSTVKRTRNMTCIICDSKFEVKQYVRDHFPKCVQKNGNPNRHSWFDHPTVRNNNGTQGTRLDDGFGPFSKKSDDEPAVDTSFSLSASQTDPPAAVEHRTTGGKGISDTTIASWLAAQSENADMEGQDNRSAETGTESSGSAWQYQVTRQEIRTADLGLEEPIERRYGPYWTLEEANATAGEEIQIRDMSPPSGPQSRGWNLQFRKDENGMDSHTVEVEGTTITTIVTRSKSSPSKTPPLFSLIAQIFPTKSTNVEHPSTRSSRPTYSTPHARLRIQYPTDHLYYPLSLHPPHHVRR